VLRAWLRAVPGHLDAQIQQYAARRCDELVESLLLAAAIEWLAENYLRFNDHEISCSVRIYDWCRRLLRETPESWPATRVQYDGPRPNAEMLAGAAYPASAKRPDIILSVGQVEVHVEAKRLSASNPLPNLYVTEGMMRFIHREYAWATTDRGVMLSYNLADDPATAVAAVNNVVRGLPNLGPAHQLHPDGNLHARLARFQSDHGLAFALKHLALDMR
jgi:hypothetical protein